MAFGQWGSVGWTYNRWGLWDPEAGEPGQLPHDPELFYWSTKPEWIEIIIYFSGTEWCYLNPLCSFYEWWCCENTYLWDIWGGGGAKGCRLFLKQEMMINYDVFSFGVSDGSKVCCLSVEIDRRSGNCCHWIGAPGWLILPVSMEGA